MNKETIQVPATSLTLLSLIHLMLLQRLQIKIEHRNSKRLASYPSYITYPISNVVVV